MVAPQFTLALAMQPAADLVPLARAAEEAGWDNIAVPDAIFYPRETAEPYPYTPDGARFWAPETPFVDPWVAIPAIGAVTERIRLYTNVTKLAIREPLAFAKTVASTAAMFPGRVAAGVGLAWMPEEFAFTGTEKRTRGKRLDEQIEILRRCTSPGWQEFHGEHYDFDELMISPTPPGRVPIYVGGHSDAAVRRAARACDGWVSAMMTPEQISDITARLGDALAAEGRRLDGFEIKVTPMVAPEVDAYADVFARGATDVITVPWYFYGATDDDLDAKIAGIHRFAEEIIQPVREELR